MFWLVALTLLVRVKGPKDVHQFSETTPTCNNEYTIYIHEIKQDFTFS